MTLSAEHISIIESKLDRCAIHNLTLRDDLLDHLCCAMEERMSAGEPFDDALIHALNQLSPDGLNAIQRETDLLLNDNPIPMKKLMYSIGLITSMSYTMGLMMKLLHMPGGEELVNYGFLGFALLFMPMLTIHWYKRKSIRPSHEKLRLIFAIVSAVLTGLAVLFKMTMTLDWSETMLILGVSVFSFAFLPLHFYGMYKKSTIRSA